MMMLPSIAASAVRADVHCHIRHRSSSPSPPLFAIVITDTYTNTTSTTALDLHQQGLWLYQWRQSPASGIFERRR